MAEIEHNLFMIAVEGSELIVTVTCRYPLTNGQFRKCVYEIALPRDRAVAMTVNEMFEEALQTFRSIKDDL